ncbi:MAG TPA: hypothetical protein VNN17_04735, partial [Terriglobia bacterium]|nr:hypothetical protein [Terriglobia bacterium]
MLAFGGICLPTSPAQTVSFNYFAAPTLVANTGRSEELGEIILSADATCGTSADASCISSAGSIQVTYTNMVIDNTIASGIRVCEILAGVTICNAPGTYLDGTFSVFGSLQGGVVSFGIRAGANFAAGDQVIISGARARIDQTVLSASGNSTTALLTAAPLIAAAFSPTANLIARSADPLSIAVLANPLVPCVVSDPPAILEIRENYPTAFADYGDLGETTFPGVPANARPLFGATNSTRIHVALAGLPEGITVNWPASVPAVAGGAVLDLVSQTTNGSDAIYAFGTPDQAASDVLAEIFELRLTSANFVFSGHESILGQAAVRAQMHPPVTPETARPRYNHPLEPDAGLPLFQLRRCNTTTGTIQLFAVVDSIVWFGNLNFRLIGPTPFTGTQVPLVLEGMLAGDYTIEFDGGGPSGATFTGYVQPQTQTLGVGQIKNYTFKFVGPTVANLQLSATPAAVCPAADTAVGTFRLANPTGDLQIIPGGTRFTFTFNRPVVGPFTSTGLGGIVPTLTAVSMTFQIPGSISLPPGGALTFAGSRLNLAGMAHGQEVSVQLTTDPLSAIA